MRALAALAAWDSASGTGAAREAVALAERLGSPELRVRASLQLLDAELANGETKAALALAHSLLELLDQTRSPDDREGILWTATLAELTGGRMEDARGHARLLSENARPLTPHHRLHAVAMALMVEELAGRWDKIRARTARAEQAVSENLATPCTMNARALLVCALAAALTGDPAEAHRLERSADALEMEGYGLTIDAPRVRLALVRGDLETAERLLGSGQAMYFAELAAQATRLDAFAALGVRERVEKEAAALLRPNTYLEPFALRALGIVRKEEKLVADAIARFQALGLDWHAAETRALL